MDGDRAMRVWTATALCARREQTTPGPQHACLAAVDAVAASGADLLLASGVSGIEQVYVTGSGARDASDLQITLGQGPGFEALDSGRPVLVSDLSAADNMRRWPTFAPEMTRRGIRAVYSLPLALGAIRVGVLDLYREVPSDLNQDQLLDALAYADTALLLVLDDRSGIMASPENNGASSDGVTLWHAEVHQAAGMVSAHLGIPVLEALVRLRASAYRQNIRLTELARFIVERRMSFDTNDEDRTIEQPREDTP